MRRQSSRNNENAVIIAAVLTAGFLLCLLKAESKDVIHFIQRNDKLNVSEVLSLTHPDENMYVLFFATYDGSASCALIEESWLSYDILKVSSQLPLQSERPYNVMASMYTRDGEECQIIWGVLYRANVSEVTVNEQKLEIISTEYGFSLFYFMERYEDRLPEEYIVLMN